MIDLRGNMARPPAIEVDTGFRIVLDARSAALTDDQFDRLCSDNRDFRMEMSADGELIIMSPAHSDTGAKNAEINFQLGLWAKKDGTGKFFDSFNRLHSA